MNKKLIAASLCAFGMTNTAIADQVIEDDLIVTRDACFGGGCALNESFPAVFQVKIKSNVPTLFFEDISGDPSWRLQALPGGFELGDEDSDTTPFKIEGSAPENSLFVADDGNIGFGTTAPGEDVHITASFPGLRFDDNDGTPYIWDLGGNENNFFVQDVTGGSTKPFVIAPGAPENTLFVGNTGHIGVGTSMPQEELHLVDGSPQIRLEDDAGTPYTWDIGGNSFNFFVQDETGNTYPLLIEDAAPTNSIRVQTSGNVGMGTPNPSAALHVQRSDNTAALLIEETGPGTLGQMTLRNNGITFFTLEDTSITAGPNSGRAWNFQNQAGTFRVTTAPAGAEMLMTPTGDMTISGTLTTGGSCSVGCDRVFEADYALPTIAEHNAKMWENGYLPNVGPTPEDGPFNVSDKMGRMLNELEHAHIFIGQQQEQITSQEERIAALEAKLEALLSK